MTIRKLLLMVASFMVTLPLIAQVNITPASGGMTLCVGNTNYTALGNIVIAETANTNFTNDNASRTFVLSAPANFQFEPSQGTISPNNGGGNDFTGTLTINVTVNTITVTYTVDANSSIDNLTISGIQVRAIGSASFGFILRTGGDADQNGNAVANNRNHGTLFSTNPPIVSISDNDDDNIVCTTNTPNITFTAHGASSYQFFVDNVAVGTGTTLNYNWTNTTPPNPHQVRVVGTANGCSASSPNLAISVSQAPSITWAPTYSSFAITDQSIRLDTNGTFSPIPGGGSFSFSGPGVSTNGANYNFLASSAGGGSHQITATYTSFGCSVSDNETFIVGGSNALTGLNPAYCVYDAGNLIQGPKPIFYLLYYNYLTMGYNIVPGAINIPNYSFVPNYFRNILPNAVDPITGAVRLQAVYTDLIKSPEAITYVFNRPLVSLAPIGGSNIVCNNSGQIFLNIAPADNGLTQTRVTGTGVVENPGGSGNWFLNPAVGGNGPRTIRYEYRDNFGNGCENFTEQNVTIIPPPVASITTIFDPVGYCTNSASFALTGSPAGGNFSGPGTFLNIFFASYGTIIGSNTIRYTYTDGNGCSAFVDRNLQVFNAASVSIRMINADTSFCLPLDSMGIYTIDAQRGGSATGVDWTAFNGSLFGTGGNSGTFAPTAPSPGFNNAVSFNNSLFQANAGIVRLRATTTGQPASCPASSAFAFAYLIPKPRIFITGLAKDEYCTDEPNFGLSGNALYKFPNTIAIPLRNGIGSVTVFNSVPPGDPALVGAVFQPSSASPGNHVIRYEFTDINGCSNFNDTTIIINENPITDFFVDSGRCATRATYFNSSTSTIPFSTTVNYFWDFGDGSSLADTSLLPSPNYTYGVSGGYPVSLTLKTNEGCSSTKSLTGANLLTIQRIPNSNFNFRFQCLGDLTLFDTLSVVQQGAFKSRTWILADNVNAPFDTIYQTTSNVPTSYGFAQAGNYQVTIVDSTTLGCTDRRRKPLFILPYLTPTATQPYSISFKDSSGKWGEDGTRSSWVHNIPAPLQKPLMYKGGAGVINTAWVTNPTDSIYNVGERSNLNSPCFNFSQLEKPMISIKLWTATQEQIAGAVLNVSTDEGITWNTLGKVGDGISWYNNIGIAGSPGNISTNDGWSGIDTTWKTAKIGLPSLSNFNPAQKIRFRITFGSPNDSSIARLEGIAVDSVWIGNKNKVLLMEHFTNYNTSAGTTTAQIATADLRVNTIRDTRRQDVTSIYYHTSFPNTDIFNAEYPEGPSSRVLYYGVSSSPRTVLDGTYYNGNVYVGGTPEARLEVRDVDARTLETSLFNLDLTTDFSTNTALIGTRITYTGNTPFAKDIILHTVITEDDSSGVVKYASIARRMLPDASGNYISYSWNSNDALSFTSQWAHGLPPTSVLGAVAFIQDANTKEVYQAAYFRGSGSYGAVTTDVEDLDDVATLSMFPNPANNEVFVIFGKALLKNAAWEVLDNLGKKVYSGTCTAGKNGFSIDLSSFASGMYHLKMEDGKGGIQYKELAVIK